MATPLAVAGDAMETLKMKIFMLKKENTDVSEKMESAEKVGTKNVYDLPYTYHKTTLSQFICRIKQRLMPDCKKQRRKSRNCLNRYTPGIYQ